MPTVAEQLRQAREAKNLTVYQVAEITKIRTDHVRALEESDYDVFPAPVYVRGFVRTYASLLQLDVNQILDQLSQELSKSAKHHEPPPLTDRRHGILDKVMYQLSRLNWRILAPTLGVILIIICAIALYRAWTSRPAQDPAASRPAPVFQSHKPGETLPLTPPPAPTAPAKK